MRARSNVLALLIAAVLTAVGCSPPSGRDAAAAGSASLQSIVDWKATYVPPSTIRPSTPTPPPLTDAPILTLRRLPNGPTCDYDPALLVPSLAVYADGRVIAPTGHASGTCATPFRRFEPGGPMSSPFAQRSRNT